MKTSLSDKTIVITRDLSQAKPFIKRLENLGANIFLFPTIKITDPDNPDQIREILKDPTIFDWIIFTSANAVRYFFKFSNNEQRLLKKVKMASVGKKTAETLEKLNITPTVIPNIYTSHDLLNALTKHDIRKKRILLPVSNLAGKELTDGLKAQGADVERIVVYRNEPCENSRTDKLIEKIDRNEIDCIVFFSPSAMNTFANLIGMKGVSLIKAKNIPIAVIGTTTARAVRENSLQPKIMPLVSDEESFVDALVRYFGGVGC